MSRGDRALRSDVRRDPATVPPPARVLRVVLARALRRRCPQCGGGRVFRGYARLFPVCSVCGLVYRREQGAQTGSMYMTAIVTQIVAAVIIALCWVLTDWSVTRFLWTAVPAVALFSVWFLPLAQSLWVGIEYFTDVSNREEWARPRL